MYKNVVRLPIFFVNENNLININHDYVNNLRLFANDNLNSVSYHTQVSNFFIDFIPAPWLSMKKPAYSSINPDSNILQTRCGRRVPRTRLV